MGSGARFHMELAAARGTLEAPVAGMAALLAQVSLSQGETSSLCGLRAAEAAQEDVRLRLAAASTAVGQRLDSSLAALGQWRHLAASQLALVSEKEESRLRAAAARGVVGIAAASAEAARGASLLAAAQAQLARAAAGEPGEEEAACAAQAAEAVNALCQLREQLCAAGLSLAPAAADAAPAPALAALLATLAAAAGQGAGVGPAHVPPPSAPVSSGLF